jgi:hypothetical protein
MFHLHKHLTRKKNISELCLSNTLLSTCAGVEQPWLLTQRSPGRFGARERHGGGNVPQRGGDLGFLSSSWGRSLF